MLQVFTNNQIQQLNTIARSSYDALVVLEDAFCHTLDRALCALLSDRTRNAAKTAYLWIGGFCYAMYLLATSPSAVRLYNATWSLILAARAWMMRQIDGYVASCLEVPAEVPAAVEPEVAQSSESVEDVWEMPAALCLLTSESAIDLSISKTPLLMAAKEEFAKSKTRKAAAKTTEAKKTKARKQGVKAKATAEKV